MVGKQTCATTIENNLAVPFKDTFYLINLFLLEIYNFDIIAEGSPHTYQNGYYQ